MRASNAGPRAVFAASMLALAVYAAAAPVTGLTATRAQESFDWSGAMDDGATLRVYAGAGEIVVREAQGRTARVHAVTRNGSGRDMEYVSDRDGSGVRVCALRSGDRCDDDGIRGRGGWRNNRAKSDFTIEVPRGVVLRLSSGNGRVTVDGATADVRAASGNGDVRVGAGAARVKASTGNGTVLVDGARGPVEASSGNGRVTISTARGPVEASTGNGNIEVRMAQLAGDGDMEFSSGNGSITLFLPDNFSAVVDASTGNGGVNTDFPIRVQGRVSRHRLQGTIGDGGRRLSASSGNGTISIRRIDG
ncbi:MAG TPA: DUF4097 family beta strand repeat-containing protein [Longimicrobium sp.]|nr:DUF4097 family beta strand repeat-containing protein [Longimicrobium sp.]